jgi:Protein of unknown function DUF262
VLNPAFQRRAVWNDKAKSFLIDTILRGKPIPKVFMRQQINASTKSSIREVVDLQQRLSTILSYVKDGFKVSKTQNEEYVAILEANFDDVIVTIAKLYPEGIAETEFARPHVFYSLFTDGPMRFEADVVLLTSWRERRREQIREVAEAEAAAMMESSPVFGGMALRDLDRDDRMKRDTLAALFPGLLRGSRHRTDTGEPSH